MTLIPEMWDAIWKSAMVLATVTISFVLINLFGEWLDDLIEGILKGVQ
ncbi:MAG TPA: hypothetical protein VII92_04140 [Anaerolineae bacterium]